MRESEQIELVLNVENSRVSIAELVPILQGFQGMAVSMNDTLNKVYSCGFDNVSIEVLGLEHGLMWKMTLRFIMCLTSDCKLFHQHWKLSLYNGKFVMKVKSEQ